MVNSVPCAAVDPITGLTVNVVTPSTIKAGVKLPVVVVRLLLLIYPAALLNWMLSGSMEVSMRSKVFFGKFLTRNKGALPVEEARRKDKVTVLFESSADVLAGRMVARLSSVRSNSTCRSSMSL